MGGGNELGPSPPPENETFTVSLEHFRQTPRHFESEAPPKGQ